MAIIQSITTPNGAESTYWRIDRLGGQYPDITAIVLGYKDHAYRLEGRPLDQREFVIGPDRTRTEIYEFIKTQPEFEEAVDA